jgi:SAM-dependent methyltransferase
MFRDYDKEYYFDKNNPWTKDGNVAIKEIHDVFSIHGEVLDLGFGMGRHSVEFAKLGCSVESCEVSKIGFSSLNEQKDQQNLPISLYLEDMFSFNFKKSYDIVFAHMVFQYAKDRTQFKEILSKIQIHTKVGGINYVRVPIEGMSLAFPFLLDSLDTLKSYYVGWDILFERSEKKKFEDGRKGNYILLIAKKL